jgi:nicotinamidase-related amidase
VKLEDFIRPLYQDLDGASRFDAVERVGRIARTLHPPSRDLDLLILFSGLGKWLEKPRNFSRVVLNGGLTESELQSTVESLRRLQSPETAVERAVAAATIVDAAGVRGFAERLAQARREGISIGDLAREQPAPIPDWVPAEARALIEERRREREKFAQALLREL